MTASAAHCPVASNLKSMVLRSNLPSGHTIDTIAPDYHVIKYPTLGMTKSSGMPQQREVGIQLIGVLYYVLMQAHYNLTLFSVQSLTGPN